MTKNVQVTESKGAVKYFESPLSITKLSGKLGHASQEFLRYQELSQDGWNLRREYLLCLILIGTRNEVLPYFIKMAFDYSGGCMLLVVLLCVFVLGLPLIYQEAFIGRYTRLTNCQMYRMCPFFYGLCCTIFLFNLGYQPMHVTCETQSLIALLRLLSNPDQNIRCTKALSTCYEYKKEGPLTNDTCKPSLHFIMCERRGPIRYTTMYHYWRTYRNNSDELFPYWDMVIGVVVSWSIILGTIVKGIEAIGQLVKVTFIVQFVIFSLILVLTLFRGGQQGLKLLVTFDFSNMSLAQVCTIAWAVVFHLGVIAPTGYMSYSAYAKFESNCAVDSFVIVLGNFVLLVYYMAVYLAVGAALASTIQVPLSAVFIFDSGIYVTLVSEMLSIMDVPNVYFVFYYSTLWSFELLKLIFCVHMLVLNLYDYFPTMKNFTVYIWVSSSVFMCLLSIGFCSRVIFSYFRDVLVAMFLKYQLALFVSLQTIMYYFYGIERLCDDIYFFTGERVSSFWYLMWYFIPIVTSLNIPIWMWIYNFQRETVTDDVFDKDLTLGIIIYSCLIALGMFATVMYIAIRTGTPNLLLSLFKPQFFWGPPERTARLNRKNFFPNVTIRSQGVPGGKDRMNLDRTTDADETLQLGNDVTSTINKDGILRDKIFFDNIGITGWNKKLQ